LHLRELNYDSPLAVSPRNRRRPDNWTSTKSDASCAFLIKLIVAHINVTMTRTLLNKTNIAGAAFMMGNEGNYLDSNVISILDNNLMTLPRDAHASVINCKDARIYGTSSEVQLLI